MDLKKTEDFDVLIDKRVESLNDEDLDLAYFKVLAQVMEATEPSEFTGFRIWESSMPWKEKNVTKLGWLFLGCQVNDQPLSRLGIFMCIFHRLLTRQNSKIKRNLMRSSSD